MIQTPVYSEFYDINEDNKRIVIENRFIEKDGKYSLDLVDLENKLKEKPKFLIFCNPHNPLGKVWTYDKLKAIGNLCIKYGVTVISDEIQCSGTTMCDNCFQQLGNKRKILPILERLGSSQKQSF